MDIKDFYLKNIKENEYHYCFKNFIENDIYIYNIFTDEDGYLDCHFEIYDSEEAITKFKELCQPNISFTDENKKWFYLLTYYLYKLGFEIKEFPRILARPPVDPANFTCDDIRNRIITLGQDDNGTVSYATRRAFVAELTFSQNVCNIEINYSIEKKFKEISTRQASFNNMHIDEKIAEIANLIEHMLKKNGKFIELEYNQICFEFIEDSTVKKYRKKIQCFRHCTDEAISERNGYSKEQKIFLVDYGLTIIKAIHELIILEK